MSIKHKYFFKDLPKNILETLSDAESPFDILVDYMNFWGRVPGLEYFKIDKVE